MRLLVPLLLITATLAALVPTAIAHDCSGTDCGPCVKGENHNHADQTGSCHSDLYSISNAGYSGASHSSPAATFPFAVLAIAGLALLVRRS